MKRRLELRKETLSELTADELARVHGGGPSFDGCPTQICTPLLTVIIGAATKAVTELTDCA